MSFPVNNVTCKKKLTRLPLSQSGPYSQSCGFSNSHVWMSELDYTKIAEHQRIDAFFFFFVVNFVIH